MNPQPLEMPLDDIAQHLRIKPDTLRAVAALPAFPSPSSHDEHNTPRWNLEAVQQWVTEEAPIEHLDENGERLITLQESAERLNVTYGTMRTFVTRYANFPAPKKRVSGRPLFDPAEIMRWAMHRNRRTQLVNDVTTREIDGLLTRTGVAELLDVEPNTVTRYSARDTPTSKDFPEPVSKIGRSRLWDPDQIRAWAEQNPSWRRRAQRS